MGKANAKMFVEGWWWWRSSLKSPWEVVFCTDGKIYTTGHTGSRKIPDGEFWEAVLPPTTPPKRLIPLGSPGVASHPSGIGHHE